MAPDETDTAIHQKWTFNFIVVKKKQILASTHHLTNFLEKLWIS